jgi:hypothetical protein
MASRFESFFKTYAMPVLRREFDREVDFIDDDGNELRFDCFYDLDEIPSGEGTVDLQGMVSVRTSDLLAKVDTDAYGNWKKARIRDQIFDVYAAMPDEYGSTVFNVRRKFEEQQHSNLYDLHGNQIPYAE